MQGRSLGLYLSILKTNLKKSMNVYHVQACGSAKKKITEIGSIMSCKYNTSDYKCVVHK